MRANRLLGAGVVSLGGLVVVYGVLGPLVLDVIHFRTSASGLNQVRGGDLAALVIVAPACMAVGWLAWRGHPAAAVLALAPAIFAMYTYSQLFLGNEFLQRPGNVERFFPLLLAMFLLATAVAVRCWGLTRSDGLPSSSRGLERGSGILLVVIAAFVVFGMHLPTLVDALRDPPSGVAYLETPNLFWVVKFYDLAIVAPAALTVGIGLLQHRLWARKPAYAILGGYVLLGWSVAGMAWTMLFRDDPSASLAQAIGMTGLAGAGAVFAYFLYRPLFRATTPSVPDALGSHGAYLAASQHPSRSPGLHRAGSDEDRRTSVGLSIPSGAADIVDKIRSEFRPETGSTHSSSDVHRVLVAFTPE